MGKADDGGGGCREYIAAPPGRHPARESDEAPLDEARLRRRLAARSRLRRAFLGMKHAQGR